MSYYIGKAGDIYQREDGSCYYLIEDNDSVYVGIVDYIEGSSRGEFTVMFGNLVVYDRYIGKRKKRLYRRHFGYFLSRKLLKELHNGMEEFNP